MRWLAAVAGLAVLIVGALLVVEPFASLDLLVLLVAGGFLVVAFNVALDLYDERRTTSWLALVVWLITAGVVVGLPSVTANALSVVVGIALLINGALRLGDGVHAPAGNRIGSFCFGAAWIILGLLALLWPGMTLLVIAELIALWMVVMGLLLLLRAFRVKPEGRRHAAKRRFERSRRLALPVLALVSSLLLVAATLLIESQLRHPDGFYDSPASITEPAGSLLRAQPYEGEIPEGTRAWRILYVTSRDDGVPAVGSALVVVPRSVDSEIPVVAWGHGTTGIVRGCAPSLTESFATYGDPPAEAIRNGWAVVAPDYIGLGSVGPSTYLIGQGEGRAMLDSVRAARQIPRLTLSKSTMLWGYSQGGHAALWAAKIGPEYAPDVELVGTGTLAPVTDLPEMMRHLQSERFGLTLGAYLMADYAANYPEVQVDDYVRPVLQITVRGLAMRCSNDLGVYLSVAASAILDRQVWVRDPRTGAFGERLADNVPNGRLETPVLIVQGAGDTVVTADMQAGFVKESCEAGTATDYRTYPETHDTIGLANSPAIPELVRWTTDRFSGIETSGCRQ